MSGKRAARELDVSGATRGVWLIKVPKYLSETWLAARAKAELGTMRISK